MKTAAWFAICVFGWGIAVFLMTVVSRGPNRLNLGTILVYNLIGYTTAILLISRGVDFGFSRNHLFAVLISILYVAANYSYYRLSHAGGQASILAPLTALYVVVTVLLGIAVLGEPITVRKLLGMGFAVLAAVLLFWEH